MKGIPPFNGRNIITENNVPYLPPNTYALLKTYVQTSLYEVMNA